MQAWPLALVEVLALGIGRMPSDDIDVGRDRSAPPVRTDDFHLYCEISVVGALWGRQGVPRQRCVLTEGIGLLERFFDDRPKLLDLRSWKQLFHVLPVPKRHLHGQHYFVASQRATGSPQRDPQ